MWTLVDCGIVAGMGKRKLTDQQIADLRADYEAWVADPTDERNADQVAGDHGVTRQTLYNLRRRWLASDGQAEARLSVERERQLTSAIEWLTGELARTRSELDAAQVEIRVLREQLDQRGAPS